MKPRTKIILKVLFCFWIASICLMFPMGMFTNSHPHVALSGSPTFTVLFAPFVAAMTVPLTIFGIFEPKAWPLILAFWGPFLVGLSIIFRRPARWYEFLNSD